MNARRALAWLRDKAVAARFAEIEVAEGDREQRKAAAKARAQHERAEAFVDEWLEGTPDDLGEDDGPSLARAERFRVAGVLAG